MKLLLLLLLSCFGLLSCDSSPKADDETSQSLNQDGPKKYLLVDDDFIPKTGRVVYDVTTEKHGPGICHFYFGDGELMKGKFNRSETREWEITQIAPKKMRILMVGHSGSALTEFPDREANDQFREAEILNEPVILTLADGAWTGAREDGKEPNQGQLKEIERMAEAFTHYADLHVYTRTPREIGESWEVDAGEFDFFGKKMISSGTFTATLDKVEEYEGHLCAFISGEYELKGTYKEGEIEEGRQSGLNMNGQFEVIRSLDEQLDLKVEYRGGMKVENKMEGRRIIFAGPARRTVTAGVQ